MENVEFDFTGVYNTYQDESADNALKSDDALRKAMAMQWDRDLATVKDQGRVPDWIGEPRPLDKDMAALLEHLYDHGCIIWRNSPCQNNAKVASIIGVKTQAAAQVTIRKCLEKELIKSRIYQGDQIFEMTMHGEFALDEYLSDKELGI